MTDCNFPVLQRHMSLCEISKDSDKDYMYENVVTKVDKDIPELIYRHEGIYGVGESVNLLSHPSNKKING